MKKSLACTFVAAALAGCAAGFVATPDIELLAAAGTVIGIPSTELTISNVKRDLGATSGTETYDVRTRAGVVYGCTLTKEMMATTVKPRCVRK
ncbi:MAG: hypothetical protein HY854_11585 [Burkholderiales bacterium]|nr:hypothetical protein [Burkholderiales bacterium]